MQRAFNEVTKLSCPNSRGRFTNMESLMNSCIPSLNKLIYGNRQLSKCPIIVSDPCQPIGVQDVNKIPDSSMTASSNYSENQYPYYGRLHGTRGNGWCPKTTNDRTDYLQVDLGAQHSVCKLATQGASGEWTTRYKLSLSLDGVSWSFYQEDHKDKVLRVIQKMYLQ